MQSIQNGEARRRSASMGGRTSTRWARCCTKRSAGELPVRADQSPPLSREPAGQRRAVGHRREMPRGAGGGSLRGRGGAGADDLRRHLTDQPLVGVRNRSVGERWRKWRRGSRARCAPAGMLGVIAASLMVLSAGIWWHLHHRHEQAELALYDGQRQLQSDGNFQEAAQSFERGLRLLQRLPFEEDLRQQLREQLVISRRIELGRQVHRLAEEIRVLYGAEAIPVERMRSLAGRCGELWAKRDAMLELAASRADLQDIAIFTAHLRGRLGERDEALKILDEVAKVFGRSAVLEHERHAAMGTQPVEAPVAKTVWEHYALGRAYLAAGDPDRARRELEAALAKDPAGRWPNFYYGLCAYRLGKFQEAVEAFSVCIGSEPGVAGYFYNLALAYGGMNRVEKAIQNYGRALELEPGHAAAALNRGVMHFQQGKLNDAEADLRRALKNGADAATVHYDLALVHMAADEPAQALQEAINALEHHAGHAGARELRDALQKNAEGR